MGIMKTERSVLPLQDGGLPAWRFLLCAFLLEGLASGFPLASGVFQEYYFSHPPFEGSKSLPLVGLLGAGLSYLLTPVILAFGSSCVWIRKPTLVFGLLLCLCGSLGGAYATQLPQLVITQGVLYGIGACCVCSTLETMLFEWFNIRRGLAIGILYAGDALMGCALPPLFGVLLDRYGQRTTLLAWTVTMAILGFPATLWLQSRGNSAQDIDIDIISEKQVWHPTKFWASSEFWLLSFCNIVQSLGNFLPILLLPALAKDLHLKPLYGNLAVSCVNLFTSFGQILFGQLSDKRDLYIPLLLSTIGSALSAFVLGGFAKSLAPMMIFGITFGLFAGGYSSMWNKFTTNIIDREKDPLSYNIIYGIFVAQRGLGYLVTSPLNIRLLSLKLHSSIYSTPEYGVTILFTGACMALSGLAYLTRHIWRYVRIRLDFPAL